MTRYLVHTKTKFVNKCIKQEKEKSKFQFQSHINRFYTINSSVYNKYNFASE